jgi:hypothetical protein
MAIALATRTVPAFFVGLERHGASAVAVLVSRIVQPEEGWLTHPGLAIHWPMHGTRWQPQPPNRVGSRMGWQRFAGSRGSPLRFQAWATLRRDSMTVRRQEKWFSLPTLWARR